jgi:hypothetical protein
MLEKDRLKCDHEFNPWKKWGPYLTERQWGTVREDYSSDGNAWDYISHDAARSKAYRWGEEGIAGISDNKSILCFAISLWNGKDPILKERLFGLTGPQGNHGEDVKEIYYYLESAPTHSYMKMLYKYPQEEFPYERLVFENRVRGKEDPEFEILDTHIFDHNNYFDVFVEYAKADTDDVLIKIQVINRSAKAAAITVLPTIWFRNTWTPGCGSYKPLMRTSAENRIDIINEQSGDYFLYSMDGSGFLFCDNETNSERLYGKTNTSEYCKDGINDYIVNGKTNAVNPLQEGTKASVVGQYSIEGGKEVTLKLRLSDKVLDNPFKYFDKIFLDRIQENNEFYDHLQKDIEDQELRDIQRQAWAGMMWSKQFYYFNINQWLEGDTGQVLPPERKFGRNNQWMHLNNSNIISMPDKWEYPWYAAWDLAFHCIPIARLDPDFAKRQLSVLVREYYMHPNGQIPAYEWNFSDVNPPVHAWATWRVYEMDRLTNNGKGDIKFLEKVFHKLLMNFTWWVNRKDEGGHNVFEGGFLGLDNIGVFDRSHPVPSVGKIKQSDGTSWMAMYSLNMLRISCELALTNPVYEETASKFFEHFLFIAKSALHVGDKGFSLWDEEDNFFYDILVTPYGANIPLKIRSIVGLIPLFAVEFLRPETLNALPDFKRRVEWVILNRPDLASLISRWYEFGKGETRLLSLLRRHRMKALIKRMLNEMEFLSDYGIRALSKYHKDNPYQFNVNGEVYMVTYRPAESDSCLFGGNSNWRGPVWFPVNYMIIRSLKKYYDYYGDDFKIEFPEGAGVKLTLKEIALELSTRLLKIFLKDENGRRPVYGNYEKFQKDEHFKNYILFYEYFHGDNGSGLGASHQTGWTGLISELIYELKDLDGKEYRKHFSKQEDNH